MAKTNLNGNTLAGATKEIASANAGRAGFFFKNVSDTEMVLNFGASATATDVLIVEAGESIYMTNSHKEPYEIRSSINVFCSGVKAYNCQVEQ